MLNSRAVTAMAHVAVESIALASGAAGLVLSKGRVGHRFVGRIYAVVILLINFTALSICHLPLNLALFLCGPWRVSARLIEAGALA